MGISLSIPHSKESITCQDLVIHSAIIKSDNVEVIECIKVSPLDSEVLTLDFCVNVIDRISESDPNNAYYIKA